MPDFVIGDDDFLLGGKPFRTISGALHYFRVHPDLWADRIDKARRMGLNTIRCPATTRMTTSPLASTATWAGGQGPMWPVCDTAATLPPGPAAH